MSILPEHITNQHDGKETVVSPPGEFHPFVNGDIAKGLGKIGWEPKPGQIRGMLVAIRKELGWSQEWAAAALGVSKNCVAKWEAGSRVPNGAASKLIFLFYSLWIDKSEKVKNAWDLVFWGGWPCRDTVAEAYVLDRMLEFGPTYFVHTNEVLVFVGVKRKQTSKENHERKQF